MMAMAWLRASAFLLLSMLIGRKVCSHVGGWITYLRLVRPWIVTQESREGFKQQELQVILAGFPRTGTGSLMQALSTLGFSCFHGMHLIKPSSARLFMKALATGNPKYWKKLLDGYACVADFPATCAYKQLLDIFPNAKVILNIRDPDKWYDSFFQTIVGITHAHKHSIFKIITPWAAQCTKKALYHHFFHGMPEDREICIKAFLQHVDEVKEQIAPHNLLVYDIEKDGGWSKLCEFLYVPIPQSVPFPDWNDRKQLNGFFDKVARVYTVVFSVYVALVSCTLVYLLC